MSLQDDTCDVCGKKSDLFGEKSELLTGIIFTYKSYPSLWVCAKCADRHTQNAGTFSATNPESELVKFVKHIKDVKNE